MYIVLCYDVYNDHHFNLLPEMTIKRHMEMFYIPVNHKMTTLRFDWVCFCLSVVRVKTILYCM